MKIAMNSLKARYDRLRLVHQTHVCMSMEAPPFKTGIGKELRRLHDTVQLHLKALRATDYEPSGPFIASILELKVDPNAVFEWQKESQHLAGVLHFQNLLTLSICGLGLLKFQSLITRKAPEKKITREMNQVSGKAIASFTMSATDSTSSPCVACKSDKHPLYALVDPDFG